MLAVKLMLLQNVEVLGLHFVSVFNSCAKPGKGLAARRAADSLGVPLEIIDFTEQQMELIKDPPHGLGSAANPCIDCHILMLCHAASRLDETGADFIVTGEVVGQRPMSQRTHALGIIDSQAQLAGKILRPLSAKALPPTPMEEAGLVDRERLEGIKGRGRSRQMALAAKYGIESYPSPAGGCLLTDPAFGVRVKDLLSHDAFTLSNAHLLKVGRHYRLDDSTKAVVGRNERENIVVNTFAEKGDALLELDHAMGPTTLLRGNTAPQNVLIAAALTARSSKAKDLPTARVRVRSARSQDEGTLVEVAPADDQAAEAFAIREAKGRR